MQVMLHPFRSSAAAHPPHSPFRALLCSTMRSCSPEVMMTSSTSCVDLCTRSTTMPAHLPRATSPRQLLCTVRRELKLLLSVQVHSLTLPVDFNNQEPRLQST